MRESWKRIANGLTRRQALSGAAAAFGLGLPRAEAQSRARNSALPLQLPGAEVCVLTPEATEGPFYFDPKLVRADITERKQGAPLTLTLQVVNAKDWRGPRRRPASTSGIPTPWPLFRFCRSGNRRLGAWRGLSCAVRNSPMPPAKCASKRFILAGILAARRISTSRSSPDPASVATGQLYFPDDLSTRIYTSIPLTTRARPNATPVTATTLSSSIKGA